MARFSPSTQQSNQGGGSGGNWPATQNQMPIPGVTKKFEPRCKICNLQLYRDDIDMMLATGWSRKAVMVHWNNVLGDRFLNRQNIHHHMKHLSVRDAAMENIIRKRAEQLKIDTDIVENFILTRTAVAEATVQLGLQSMVKGHTTVEVRDMLQAVKQLQEMDLDLADVTASELEKEMQALVTAVKHVITDENLQKQIFEEFEKILGIEQPTTPKGVLEAVVDPDYDFDSDDDQNDDPLDGLHEVFDNPEEDEDDDDKETTKEEVLEEDDHEFLDDDEDNENDNDNSESWDEPDDDEYEDF